MSNLTRPKRREECVQHIVDRIRANTWLRGTSAKELAAEWGILECVARNYAAEAQRRVTSDDALDAKSVGIFAISRMQELAEDAIRDSKKDATDALGDKERLVAQRNAISALDSLLKFSVTPDPTRDAWEALSDAEKWRRIDALKARVAELEAELPPREDSEAALEEENGP